MQLKNLLQIKQEIILPYTQKYLMPKNTKQRFSNHLKTPFTVLREALVHCSWCFSELLFFYIFVVHYGIQYQTSSPVHKIQLQSLWQHSATYSSVGNYRMGLQKEKKTEDPI